MDMAGSDPREKNDVEGLHELLYEEMRDLYHAENQLVRALPRMAKAANNDELRSAFEEHLSQTEGHVDRLEQAFDSLGKNARPKICKAMQGLIEEDKETIRKGKEMGKDIADLGLIVAAQKVEYYEISGYGSVRTLAEKLGENRVAELLSENENEEKKADELLTKIAQPLLENASAPQSGEK
jgi:ferritin-like metal-binding protein YciE